MKPVTSGYRFANSLLIAQRVELWQTANSLTKGCWAELRDLNRLVNLPEKLQEMGHILEYLFERLNSMHFNERSI